MSIIRHKTRIVKIGSMCIGGHNPIAVQSMSKTKTSDIEKTVRQIKGLERAGCEIVRVAVKDSQDAKAIRKIKGSIGIPLVADIHFNWRLALQAVDSGADKIRLNPGNIYKKDEIREITKAAKLNHIPIRVGVNSGSLRGHNATTPQRHKSQAYKMVKSALDYIKILEGFKFYNIVVSLKASNILDTIEAYRKIAKSCDYPLHLGVTATGAPLCGALKSSIAIGASLLQGIGDTIRISLTDEPRQEVIAAKIILESLELRRFGPVIISCPTCGRCEVDLIKIVKQLESKLSTVNCQLSTRPPKVAVMGCVVNGPGEAKEADIGVAFGKKEGIIFRSGKAIKKVSLYNCLDTLLSEIRRLNAQ
jgi:(E)-4-hydroxy-3-methylbut-2-enyl-diphosphate synthase